MYMYVTCLSHVYHMFVTCKCVIIFAGSVSARSIVLMVLLIATSLLLFGLLVLGWFSYLLPKIRIKMGQVSVTLRTSYCVVGIN